LPFIGIAKFVGDDFFGNALCFIIIVTAIDDANQLAMPFI